MKKVVTKLMLLVFAAILLVLVDLTINTYYLMQINTRIKILEYTDTLSVLQTKITKTEKTAAERTLLHKELEANIELQQNASNVGKDVVGVLQGLESLINEVDKNANIQLSDSAKTILLEDYNKTLDVYKLAASAVNENAEFWQKEAEDLKQEHADLLIKIQSLRRGLLPFFDDISTDTGIIQREIDEYMSSYETYQAYSPMIWFGLKTETN